MKLDELKEQWATDCIIDDNHLGEVSTKTPMLHSKYISTAVDMKLKQSKIKFDLATLKKNKSKWYRGEMSKEELDELNWPQWQHNKIMKGEMSEVLDADSDVIILAMKLEYINTIIYMLESILGQIKSRDFQLKNGIEWKKFIAGN